MESALSQLKEAASNDNTHQVRSLIEEYGGDMVHSALTDQGSTVLMVSCATGSMGVVNYLVNDCCTDVNKENSNGTTALVFACNSGNLDAVRCLCEHGAEVNHRIHSGDTPLTVAADVGFTDIVEFLCHSKDLEIEGQNNEGRNALHCASTEGHVAVVSTLLTHGANVDALVGSSSTSEDTVPVQQMCTPLVLACMHGNSEVVSVLLAHGADYSLISDYIICRAHAVEHERDNDISAVKDTICSMLRRQGWLPRLDLRRCCETDDQSRLLELLQKHPGSAEVLLSEALAGGGATGLMVACLHGAESVVRTLLSLASEAPYQHRKHTTKVRSGDGRTALSYAAWGGKAEIIELLAPHIASGELNVNDRNDEGKSALYFACLNGHHDAVSRLLKYGATCDDISEDDICKNLYLVNSESLDKLNERKAVILDALGFC